MTTPAGAVAPYQGQGSVAPASGAIDPSAIIDARSVAAHAFMSVIRHLVTRAGVFTEESGVLRALEKVDAFEKHLVAAKDHKNVVQEGEPAKVEDVRLRRAPNASPAVPAAYGPTIDYALLAKYIAMEMEAKAAAQPAIAAPPSEPPAPPQAPPAAAEPPEDGDSLYPDPPARPAHYVPPPPPPTFNPTPE